MVTLENVSCQLMKPVKDLANWDFPLSEVLEEYYTLLSEPNVVNFGEAALVLQNSVNVYVRRVETLLTEASCLSQQFINYEIDEKTKTPLKSKKCISRKCINLEDFKFCNLEDEIGNNINIKCHHGLEKPVKLITKRFTQLEDMMNTTHNTTKIYDIYGEVIGKKYDFRCNQYINMDGMLVDEPVPTDFMTPELDRTETSGYCSNTSMEALQDHCCSPTQYSDNGSINMEVNNTLSVNSSLCEKETELADNTTASSENTCTSNKEESINHESTTNSVIDHDKNMNNLNNVKDHINRCTDYSQELTDICSKRYKSTKNLINTADNLNKDAWKPIPFTHNTSDIIFNNKSNKKFSEIIYNDISQEKGKNENRKRKMVPKLNKRDCLFQFLQNESNLSKKKICVNSEKSPTFMPLEKEDVDEIQRAFKECFNEGVNTFHYQTLRNITMNLLEPQSSSHIEYQDENNTFHETDLITNSLSIDTAESRSPSPDDVYSPLALTTCNNVRNDINFLPDYQQLVENRMKELFEESDVHTELELFIAKWHELLKPKLVDAEQRSVFHIREYALHIMKFLVNKNHHKLKFDDIVQGESAYEVTRYFLALLQLANSYNINISTDTNSDNIEIRVLNTITDF